MRNWLKQAALVLALPMWLAGCGTTRYDACPPYPIAGVAVADELETHCADCEATWEWLSRIATLKEQLDLCRVQ